MGTQVDTQGMADHPISMVLYLSIQVLMIFRGFQIPLPEGHKRIKRISKVVKYFFLGWLLAFLLNALFSFWDATSR